MENKADQQTERRSMSDKPKQDEYTGNLPSPPPSNLRGADLRFGYLLCEQPLAISSMISYRYRGPYGFIMIAAISATSALAEAGRSTDKPTIDRLDVWNGDGYVPVSGGSIEVWC